MANPPITIGPFANVPAPGSPIRSDWAQQLTQYAVDGNPGRLPHWSRSEAGTSGDITTATVIATGSLAAVAGRVYDVTGFVNVASVAAGNTAATIQVIVNSIVVATTDVYIPSPNVATCGNVRALWRATATATVGVQLNLAKAWWGANPVRYSAGVGLPRGIVVIDLGVAAAPVAP